MKSLGANEESGIGFYKKWRAPVLVAVLCLLTTFAAFYSVRGWEQQRLQADFEKSSSVYHVLFTSRIHSYFSELDAVQRFFTGSNHVSRSEYQSFVESVLMKYPEIKAFMWVPEVQNAQRRSVEGVSWEKGLGGHIIHEHPPFGEHEDIAAGQRDTYYPVTYVEPLETKAEVIGFDVASIARMRMQFERARANEETIVLKGLSHSGYSGWDKDSLIIQPVYKAVTDAENAELVKQVFIGFVLLQFDVGNSLEAAISRKPNNSINIALLDVDKTLGQQLLYSSTSSHGEDQAVAEPFGVDSISGIKHVLALEVDGQSWSMLFYPGPDYRGDQRQWESWFLLVVGIVASISLVMLTYNVQHRRAAMQIVVDERSQALEKSQQQQRTILDVAGDGIITIDDDGVILSFNHTAEKIFGYQAEDVVGRNVSRLLPEDERDEHEGYTENTKLHQPRIINQSRDLQGRKKDGSLFPMELNVAPFGLDEGHGFVGVLRDITARKRAENELQEQKEKLSDILENTDDAYLQIDWMWRVTYANRRAESLLGIEVSEVLLYDIRESLPDIVSMFYKALRATLVKREPQQVVVFYGPTMKYLEANSTPTKDGLIVYFRDVSQRIKSETEMIKAKEAAEKASIAKSQYLSRMSHELRTPMNAVLGFAQLLQMDDSLNSSQRVEVEEIMSAGRHLLNLIDDVLELTSIEAGKYNFKYSEINIAQIAADSISLVKEMAKKYGVDIVCKLSEHDERRISADPKAIKQILINLLSNAIKYNHQGGSVTLNSGKVSDTRVRISVTDTGEGIDKEFHELLFDPFERLGREGEIEGTGIGLSVVKSLVEGMKGSIGVESKPDKGSTFWVEFELYKPG